MNLLKRLARDSLVHFVTVGVLIYDGFGLLKGELIEDSGRTITVTQGDMMALSLRAAEGA
jgi:hypothetical protein